LPVDSEETSESIEFDASRSKFNIAINRLHCLRKPDRDAEAQPILEMTSSSPLGTWKEKPG
jgi:hypothetical protein